MFNIGSGELVLIAVVALLVLGPKRLPELARGLGKFLREFRRQTDEVRGVVEREFYKMDQDMEAPLPLTPAAGAVPIANSGEGPTLADGIAPVEEPLDPNDHSDPRHPDYDKPDDSVTPEEPTGSHLGDSTETPTDVAAAPAASASEPVTRQPPVGPAVETAPHPVSSELEKKASG